MDNNFRHQNMLLIRLKYGKLCLVNDYVMKLPNDQVDPETKAPSNTTHQATSEPGDKAPCNTEQLATREPNGKAPNAGSSNIGNRVYEPSTRLRDYVPK